MIFGLLQCVFYSVQFSGYGSIVVSWRAIDVCMGVLNMTFCLDGSCPWHCVLALATKEMVTRRLMGYEGILYGLFVCLFLYFLSFS